MSVTSSSAAQQKFTSLRKRLDQLGYRQPLGIESLPLVERLFADLIHTTDSLKHEKLKVTSLLNISFIGCITLGNKQVSVTNNYKRLI